MNKTGSLLLVSILAVALLAPSARSQSKKTTLDDVWGDVVRLQSSLKDMQRTADTRDSETKAMLTQILGRFSSIDSNILKLEGSLSAIKTEEANSTRELQDAKSAVKSIKDTLDKLDLEQKFLDLKNGMSGVRKEISNLQNTETALPSSRQAYDSAWSLLNQAFYDDAIAEFREFVKAYPKDSRTPKAQLNIGTAYVSQKKFDQAIIEFDTTIQNYPESDTKCIALYKKGLALEETKKAAPAREVFLSVVKECPNSEEASLAADKVAKRPAAGRGARGTN